MKSIARLENGGVPSYEMKTGGLIGNSGSESKQKAVKFKAVCCSVHAALEPNRVVFLPKQISRSKIKKL